MIPYNNETREDYIKRSKARHLHIAEMHHSLEHKHSTWIQLFTWVQADEIYGEHWDRVIKGKNDE